MSKFYLKVEDDIYFMDATTQVTFSSPGSLTSLPLENGRSAADNYVEGPVTVTFDGVISDVKAAGVGQQAKSTTEYLDGLLKAKARKIPILVKYRTDREDEEPNFFITDFQTTQNKDNGNARGLNSYRVSVSFQQARYVDAAEFSTKPPQAYIDAFQEETKKAQSARQAAEEEAEKARRAARRAVQIVPGGGMIGMPLGGN